MQKVFFQFKIWGAGIGLLLLLAGCTHDVNLDHKGSAFSVPFEKTMSIQDLDKQYRQYLFRKIPVRIMGEVKYQCHIRGAWAFLAQGDNLVLIDFASSSPNILLPTRKINSLLMVEGLVTQDDTVFNKYHLIPTAFEYQR